MTVNCLACDGTLGEVIFSIPDLPLVDSFCKSPEEALAVSSYTVDLRQCNRCSTIQIASPPDTREIYKNYIYESSSSPDLSEHFDAYAGYIASLSSSNNKRVLEVGSNDGLLLRKLSAAGFTKMVGIDPSPQTAQIDINGVEIINNFFCESTVAHLESKSFNIIIANNCFSHIPNLSNVLKLCAKLLEESGTLVVEVQSCLDLVEGVIFDYIYHEHYFYHTAQSFEKVAKISGLELYHIDHVPTKGGSYRLLLGHPGQHPVDSSVDYWKYREELVGIHSIKPWKLMTIYLANIKARLNSFILNHKRPLVGYGASATGTVFAKYMDIERSIKVIVDDNPIRQGLFAPGTAIPVLPSSAIAASDVCLILAWRHSKYILPRLNILAVPCILPLPFFQIYQ